MEYFVLTETAKIRYIKYEMHIERSGNISRALRKKIHNLLHGANCLWIKNEMTVAPFLGHQNV